MFDGGGLHKQGGEPPAGQTQKAGGHAKGMDPPATGDGTEWGVLG